MARRAADHLPLHGRVRVHVNVDMDTSIKPYTVVEARIRGSELPDEWVLLGNHRDAWVHRRRRPGRAAPPRCWS